ncbi:MAG: phage baseplate assembly protein [Anaerolineae bacterium]|nr:phage baseplate assembly protein [Anaerolineae bacterium]
MGNPHNNRLTRVRLDETDDSGDTQVYKSRGRKREQLGNKVKVPRIGVHGFSSHPWKGSHAYAIHIGGNPEQTQVSGGEHPDKRFRNLKEGESVLYKDPNNWIHVKADGSIHGKCEKEIVLEAPKIILIGDVYLGAREASRDVAAVGTVDDDSELNGADKLVSNFLTKVWGI